MQPTATFPTGNASEIFGGDVVKPSQWNEVVNGMVEVSDAPGLGLELVSDAASQCPFSPASDVFFAMQDRDALERLKARRPVSCRDIASGLHSTQDASDIVAGRTRGTTRSS